LEKLLDTPLVEFSSKSWFYSSNGGLEKLLDPPLVEFSSNIWCYSSRKVAETAAFSTFGILLKHLGQLFAGSSIVGIPPNQWF